MEALRAAIAAAERTGQRLVVEFFGYSGPSFVQKRLEELEELSEICDRIERNPVLGRDRDTEASLKRCVDSISDMKVLFQEIISSKQDHLFRQSWKFLVGKDVDEEIVRLFNRLRREKASLELQIATATSDAQYEMGEDHDTDQSSIVAINYNEDEAFRSAVFMTDPVDERLALISTKGKRADGTCTWVLGTDAYRTWMDTRCPGLWITGGPGIGKSMMAIFMTEQLELKTATSANESVIYFFCDRQGEESNSAQAILRGLIWQLVRLKPSLIKHGLSELLYYRRKAIYDTRMVTLCRTFNNMVEDPDAGCIFCVIDGLDECDSTSSELINCLLGVTTSRFKPIILSRPLDCALTNSLSKYVRLRLDTDAEKEVKTDLNAFIQQRVQQLSDDGGYPPALRQVLYDTFIQKSEGTFLWVGLAAHELEKRPLAEVETCLRSLPSGLSGIYSRVLRSIDPVSIKSVSRLLIVVTTAYSHLSIKNVVSLLDIKPAGQLTAAEVVKSLIAQCGSLLFLSPKPASRKKVIRLVHHSVKDYLFRSSEGNDQGPEAFRLQPQKAHLEFASLCLDTMESSKLQKPRKKDIQAFRETGFKAQYTMNYFSYHAKNSGREFSSLVRRTLPFLAALIYALDCGSNCLSLTQGLSPIDVLPILRHILDKPLGLYLAIHFPGYTRGMKPLHAAALWENGEVVRVLLEKSRHLPRKWSASATDRAGDTPLHAAASRSPVSSVQALLDYGSDPNVSNTQGHTPLHKAVFEDHSEIVRLLLSAGAQASAQDLCGRTPLFFAAAIDLRHGAHSDGFCNLDTDSVMKQLLEAGSAVNRGDEYGISPLHIAVRRNCARHTRLLLHWGAYPDVANYWGFKPLHYIAGDQDDYTFDEYRARDRYPNSRERNFYNPNFENPNLANANLRNANYYISEAWGDARGRLESGTTWSLTNEKQSISEIEEILGCFKSRGADLNVQAADGTTPLMCCAYRNKAICLTAARWLIAAGVDVDTQDDRRNSCLHLAVVQRKRSLVSALIDAGASLDLRNNKGMTPKDLIWLRPDYWEVLETEVKIEDVE